MRTWPTDVFRLKQPSSPDANDQFEWKNLTFLTAELLAQPQFSKLRTSHERTLERFFSQRLVRADSSEAISGSSSSSRATSPFQDMRDEDVTTFNHYLPSRLDNSVEAMEGITEGLEATKIEGNPYQCGTGWHNALNSNAEMKGVPIPQKI